MTALKLDYQKELTPVLYGDSAVKVIEHPHIPAGQYGFSMHWHDRMEILVIHSGSLIVHSSDLTEEAVVGEVVIFPPCSPHSGISGKDGVSYDAIMFDISKFYNLTGISNKYLTPLHEQKFMLDTKTADPETVESAGKILELYKSNDEISALLIVGEIYRLVGLILKNNLSGIQNATPDSGRFKEVLDFIGTHFCEDISSAGLSLRFGYDETYFCRRFKAVTGLSPMIYIRILRLEKAKKMIKAGMLSLGEIASECGFSDPGYFSRCFKRHFGITPAEYGQKYRK